MDGLEMIEMIRELNPMVYILVLTSHEEFSYARRAMQSGVKDYILKSEESLSEILARGVLPLTDGGGDVKNNGIPVKHITERNRFLQSLVTGDRNEAVSETLLR